MYRFTYSNGAVAFLGHINVMVLAGVESGVVRIQTSVLVVLHLKFSLFAMNIMRLYPTRYSAYRAEIHDGEFANGRKGIGMLHI